VRSTESLSFSTQGVKVTITRRYELSSVRSNVLSVISDNIVDPLTGLQARSATTEWIFDGMPEQDRLGQGSGGWKFPIIVFDFSEIDAEVKVLDMSKQMITHTLSIECHARTRLQANELAEQIKYILEVSNRSDLSLHLVAVDGSTNDVDFIGGNKFYTKTIDYRFERFD